MTDCPYVRNVECAGPAAGDRFWRCPVHQRRMTRRWTDHCRERADYFARFNGRKKPIVARPSLKPNGHGPGSKLLAMWEAAGVPHCQQCLMLAAKMDGWGKRGCADRVGEIVRQILPRARRWMALNHPWVHRLAGATGLEDATLKLAIRRKVHDAIEQAEDRPVQSTRIFKPLPWQRAGPPIKRRNLIYHVYPTRINSVWLHNIRSLLHYWRAFNGRKLVTVALASETEPLEIVQTAFGACQTEIEWLPIRNDPELREVAGFRLLVDAIQSRRDDEASFFAHTKGNTSAAARAGIPRWRNAMLYHLLARWEECVEVLRYHPCVGTTKMVSRSPFPFPSGLRRGLWMFSGTFFWFRHDAVFHRDDWMIPHDRYGAEAWLGGLFAEHEAFSMFQPWPPAQWPLNSPYALDHYPSQFDDPDA